MDPHLHRRMSSSNPFASLFPGSSQDSEHSEPPEPSLNDQLEEIFSFTLNEKISHTKDVLYLEEVSKDLGTTVLKMDNIDQALFERLLICQKDSPILVNNKRLGFRNPHAIEMLPMKYLYDCYVALHANRHLKPEDRLSLKDKIVQNVATSVFQPDIYPDQDLAEQMFNVLLESGPHHDTFLVEASRRVLDEEGTNDIVLTTFIDRMNRKMTEKLRKSRHLLSFDCGDFSYFEAFTSNDFLAEIFLDLCVPLTLYKGSEYPNTPIGALLSLSILPQDFNESYTHLSGTLDRDTNTIEQQMIWSRIEHHKAKLNVFFLQLLKRNNTVRTKLLTWFGRCLQYNSDRGKLSHQRGMHMPFLNINNPQANDGFMLNVCALLVDLCQPFCVDYTDGKILKVDPTYAAVPTPDAGSEASSKGVNMHGLSAETCFVPIETHDGLEETRKTAEKYNFMTEIFFMAHKAIDLSFRGIVQQLIEINQEVNRLMTAHRDAAEQTGLNSEISAAVKERLTSEYTKFVHFKCALCEPKLLSTLCDFTSATCYWLSQVAVNADLSESESATFAPLEERAITFPLPEKVPFTLKCIPEFIVENILTFLVHVYRYSPATFEEAGFNKLEPILTFLLIYMGSSSHMKNPHLRARLAEGLDALLPNDDDVSMMKVNTYQRTMLFTHHPHRGEIVNMLMRVFVSIEITGQSVEFEQKFHYRRPMYQILKYLWNISEHQLCFKALACEAEANMEAVEAPLFLRFINLLINDAIYLLDESLSNMAKLKEMQTAQANGEWNSLSDTERTENLRLMGHTGRIAQYDNTLAKDTSFALAQITSKISSVFTHPTIVDRVVAMLNYFLLNLVGPNRKNFKVKNGQDYAFDPKQIVLDIIQIYVNLKDSDAFCLAVSQDGRSYSPSLFEFAEDVLVRVAHGSLLGELRDVADKVARKAIEYKENEEAMAEAPEHYLDPIMSTLMTDPVILPSSKKTVDRTTIARHLLSDQTDPFNRSPLSMDQLVPDLVLKAEIDNFIRERQKKAKGETNDAL